VAGGRTTALPLPPAGERTLRLVRLDATPEAIVAYLRTRLAGGGCAAVICNTVGRAQELYRYVRDAALVKPADCLLFHARFPFAWRQEKECQVLRRFGKSGERPERAIVVATQVIEQSLDLDFDYMASDLCPVDLLIQRAGRLWRHDRPTRPAKEPELALAVPGRTSAGHPDFGPSAHVYEPFYLLRTLACLEGKESLILPAESAALVEAVYDEAAQTGGAGLLAAPIAQACEKMQRERRASVANARTRLVLPPEDEDFLTGENVALEEDAPQVHEALRALTRETPEGVTLICLHRLPTGDLGGDPARPGETLDPGAFVTPEAAKRLLALGVQIQRPDLVAYYGKQPPPAAWREHPTLRHCRLAVFADGVSRLEGTPYSLLLDRELGLRVSKEV
jgi:CRISPR-associated endonuclease/helicase Cas3